MFIKMKKQQNKKDVQWLVWSLCKLSTATITFHLNEKITLSRRNYELNDTIFSVFTGILK